MSIGLLIERSMDYDSGHYMYFPFVQTQSLGLCVCVHVQEDACLGLELYSLSLSSFKVFRPFSHCCHITMDLSYTFWGRQLQLLLFVSDFLTSLSLLCTQKLMSRVCTAAIMVQCGATLQCWKKTYSKPVIKEDRHQLL